MKMDGHRYRHFSGRLFQGNNWKVRPEVQIGDIQDQIQVGIAEVEVGSGMGNVIDRSYVSVRRKTPYAMRPGDVKPVA